MLDGEGSGDFADKPIEGNLDGLCSVPDHDGIEEGRDNE